MKEYFGISYEKDKVLKYKEVDVKALVITLIELERENYKIIAIKDNFGDYHNKNDLIDIFKESIDIEYEDVENKLEAYNMSFDYFKGLYKNSFISEKIYEKYIQKLKEYKKSIKDKDEFIEKVKDLYINGV